MNIERIIEKIEDEIDAQAICDGLKEYEAGETVSLAHLKDELGLECPKQDDEVR